MVISTSRLNSYGSRVLTEGIDWSQYAKNPVLLWMHQRSCGSDYPMPIGRVENIRVDGDRLIGTPVFDTNDSFAKMVADKWERGFLNMCSAGIDIIETSTDPSVLVPGQSRATVTKSRLNEVSIVDIGSNDDAMKLMSQGRQLCLAAGAPSDLLPLIDLTAHGTKPQAQTLNKQMNKETLTLLGLTEGASEKQVHDAVALLRQTADKVQTMELSAIGAAVDQAIGERRVTAAKRDHFIELGKKVGVESLKETLALMTPAVRPTDTLQLAQGANGAPAVPATYSKLSEVPSDKLMALKSENPSEYARLYKAEYGVELHV